MTNWRSVRYRGGWRLWSSTVFALVGATVNLEVGDSILRATASVSAIRSTATVEAITDAASVRGIRKTATVT